ncbi:DUF4350 domain-containing protein [Streptomyces sp. ST2-7A]|uniref:DUF4350 domain-containing protein n=1 Tax=Streptomyces sp. ST2-7A TaxID=2907214 RepID=UPI001F337DCB|nr:DUF4350 domain-containing protein [Streptomyces sp. ST2-7A]MCE7082372.1 DUF4350 domain-containing protein [Streptomyces sp. ST2-7A]
MSTGGAPVTSVSPDGRRLWHAARGPLLAAAVILLTAALVALLTTGESGYLNPRSATPQGAHAVVELLAERGVETTEVSGPEEAAEAAGPDTTLLVVVPDLLSADSARLLHNARGSGAPGRTVLLAPTSPAVLDLFAPGVTPAEPVEVGTGAPECRTDGPHRAGPAELGGMRWDPGADAERPGGARTEVCHLREGLPTLLFLTPPDASDGSDTVLLGTPHPLLNENLAEEGNAALALNLLGAHPELVWYVPVPEDLPGGGDESFVALLDPAWRWAALQLGIATLLAALWRGRRLGPVVAERLPAVVRAAETTEGRARLYHRAGARDRAADALRGATRRRLAPRVGLTRGDARDAGALAGAVAARTGEPVAALHALLHGPRVPADDRELVRLADELDALERRVADPVGDSPADSPRETGTAAAHRTDPTPNTKDETP